MTPSEFIDHWKHSPLNEKQGAQIHFFQLCELLGVPRPTGTSLMDGYGFEVNVDKVGGGTGYADGWKRGCFAWEYKSPGENLGEALKQLKLYASDLENPPLLIVSDMRRIELHTNWTNMVQEKHVIALDDLADAGVRQKLKWAFGEDTVQELRPKRSANATTEEVAKKFVAIAQNLRERGHDPEKVAHFVNRMVFCMFAEDIDLLPRKMFEGMLQASLGDPKSFVRNAETLFTAMASRDGRVNWQPVEWFNGGLFEYGAALPLTEADIRIALDASQQNWSEINPSIMGTLFERGVDPAKRSQLGKFYTDAEKIMMIVRPVIIEPLLREWAEARVSIEGKLAQSKSAKSAAARTKAFNDAQVLRVTFLERLKNFRVLDPACGSGNFLYLGLKALKDIEFRVNFEAQELGLPPMFPSVGPECVRGIEINPFAAELARVAVWIGEIQWMREKNFGVSKGPILKPLETIECRDALLNEDGTEATWPAADVIIGNPPFLGGKRLRAELGHKSVDLLFAAFSTRVAAEADLVCYWFQKALDMLETRELQRVGFVSTNSIRGGANREVLSDIIESGRIFAAWSDLPWIVDGADVRVSVICFDGNDDLEGLSLDGNPVKRINADLTAGTSDLTKVAKLRENSGVAFMGDTKGGAFDVPGDLAREWLTLPVNPNGRPNSDVLRPWVNGMDVTRRSSGKWIIDFGWSMNERDASLYEAPFSYALSKIKPVRCQNNRDAYAKFWWRHVEPRPGLMAKSAGLQRWLVTPEVSRYRVFRWLDRRVLPDHKLQVIAREDDTSFGILAARIHRVWSLGVGSWHGVGNDPRYTISTCFETFPFPQGLSPDNPASKYADDARAQNIATAAARLNELRENWLNPPDLVKRAPECVGFSRSHTARE